MMERIGIEDEKAAIREVEKNDAAHAKTMHHLFHADWQEPLLYDKDDCGRSRLQRNGLRTGNAGNFIGRKGL